MQYRVPLLLLFFTLSGCILMDQQAATTAKTALVGKSRSEILACAGVPDQTFRDGATEYLAYSGSSRARVNVAGGNGFYSGNVSQAQCVVNIAIRNNRVASVNYRSSGGAITAPDEACGIVLKGCL